MGKIKYVEMCDKEFWYSLKCVVIRTAQGAAGERKINKYKKGKYYG